MLNIYFDFIKLIFNPLKQPVFTQKIVNIIH